MSTTRLTWRPATADDVGRLARFRDGHCARVYYGELIKVFSMSDFPFHCSEGGLFECCDVQDVETEDVEVMRTLLTASHHLLMGSIGPSDGPTSWIETRARLLDRMQPFIEKATQ